MKKNKCIGIDIGGTNTDAVLIDERQRIIAKNKVPTQSAIEEGVESVLRGLLSPLKNFDKDSVEGIFIGTTQATNAILELKDLNRVGVLRIAGHQPETLKCCASWPQEHRRHIFVGCRTLDGGYECDGRPITPFDARQAKEAIQELIDRGAESLAINGVFSPLHPEQEQECARIIQDVGGKDFPYTLSSQIGGIGFIERENAAILNSALKKSLKKGFQNIEKIKSQLGFECPLWITQNDGSITRVAHAMEYPLLTISSGPTNSFVGASKLASLQDAIVVDIGGTSTDIGMIQEGYPKHSMHHANIGGISLHFRMPDVIALAIGGGSYIEMRDHEIRIGPQSVGRDLFQKAQLFGGSFLTLTDAAYAAGYMDMPQAMAPTLSSQQGKEILEQVLNKMRDGISKMQGKRKDLPVIVVGGGASLLSIKSNQIIPENYNVANAYGAALAEISCTIERVVVLDDREKILDEMKEHALQLAIERGADPYHTKIVDRVIIPYHYMPNPLARVSMKASGKRALV